MGKFPRDHRVELGGSIGFQPCAALRVVILALAGLLQAMERRMLLSLSVSSSMEGRRQSPPVSVSLSVCLSLSLSVL